MSIDTDISEKPLSVTLDVRGKLENTAVREGVRLLDVKPTNRRLNLSTRDGLVIVDHIHLEPGESLQIVFLGYFKVDLEELY